MNWGSIWQVLSVVAPVIIGVVGFIVLLLKVRALTLQNQKLAEELLKLSAERQKREATIEIASRDDIIAIVSHNSLKPKFDVENFKISSLFRLFALRYLWLVVLFVLICAVLSFWLGLTWGR